MQLQKITKMWFDFPDDPDNASFEITHLRAGEIAAIVRKTHSQRFELRKKENDEFDPVPIFKIDSDLEKDLTVIAAISDWKNILDGNGETLACNDDNKLKLCKELSEDDLKAFLEFLTDSRKKLAKIIKEQAEKERKN